MHEGASKAKGYTIQLYEIFAHHVISINGSIFDLKVIFMVQSKCTRAPLKLRDIQFNCTHLGRWFDFLSFTSLLTWTWLMMTLTTTMILFDLFVIVADSSGVNLFSECG